MPKKESNKIWRRKENEEIHQLGICTQKSVLIIQESLESANMLNRKLIVQEQELEVPEITIDEVVQSSQISKRRLLEEAPREICEKDSTISKELLAEMSDEDFGRFQIYL